MVPGENLPGRALSNCGNGGIYCRKFSIGVWAIIARQQL
jgi:hypothetical protein